MSAQGRCVSARCEDTAPVTTHRLTCPDRQSELCQGAKRKTSENFPAAPASAHTPSEPVQFRARKPYAVRHGGGGVLGIEWQLLARLGRFRRRAQSVA